MYSNGRPLAKYQANQLSGRPNRLQSNTVASLSIVQYSIVQYSYCIQLSTQLLHAGRLLSRVWSGAYPEGGGGGLPSELLAREEAAHTTTDLQLVSNSYKHSSLDS